MPSATIADVFPPDDERSLFVMSMCLARNDIRVAVEHGNSSANDDKDNAAAGYFSRQTYVHLYEALDALDHWCALPAIKTLIDAVEGEAKDDLKTMRRVRDQVGHKTIEHTRNSSAHYPTPGGRYKTEQELASVLDAQRAFPMNLSMRFEIDGHSGFTLDFAQEVSLRLAYAKHSTDTAKLQAEDADVHAAAMAFLRWSFSIFEAWMATRGAIYGEGHFVDDEGGQKVFPSNLPDSDTPIP